MSLNRSQMLLMLALTALVLLVIAQVWRGFAGIELHWSWSWLALGQGVGLGIGLSLASYLVYYLWPAYRGSASEYMDLVLTPLHRVDRVWLGLLPGLSEELLFRGVALPALGLLGSSLLFGLLHIWDRRQWPYALWATVLGLVLGGAMELSGNLLVPVVAHICVNWISCFFWPREPRQA